jgi:hypothetical protein
MSLLGAAKALADQPWSIALHESLYGYPIVESIHVWALCLFVGLTIILDLRLTGLTFRTVPVSEVVRRILPWQILGFTLMVISGVLFVVFNVLMGGTATFRQMMSVVSHSQFVSVIGTIVTYVINYMRGTMAMSGATSLSAFLPNLDEQSFAFRLARSVDLFLIWWLIVLAIGLSVLYRRKTGGVAATLFSIYGAIVVLIAFIASR